MRYTKELICTLFLLCPSLLVFIQAFVGRGFARQRRPATLRQVATQEDIIAGLSSDDRDNSDDRRFDSMILPTGSDKGTESSVATKVKLVTLNELEDEWTRQSDAPFSISVAIEMALGSSGEEGTFIQLLDETDSEDADHDTQAVLPGAAIKAKGKKKKSMVITARIHGKPLHYMMI